MVEQATQQKENQGKLKLPLGLYTTLLALKVCLKENQNSPSKDPETRMEDLGKLYIVPAQKVLLHTNQGIECVKYTFF